MNTIEPSTNPTLLQMLIRSKVKAIPLRLDDHFVYYANYGEDGKNLPIPTTHNNYITSIMRSLNNDRLLKRSIMGLLAINIFKEYYKQYEKEGASDKVKQLNNLKERIQKLKNEKDGQKELALNTILSEAHNLILSEESGKIEKFIKDAYRKKSLPDLPEESVRHIAIAIACTFWVSFTYFLVFFILAAIGIFNSWSALNILIAVSPAVISFVTFSVLYHIVCFRYRHADNWLKEDFLTFVEKNDICNFINTHVGYDKHCLDAIETACKEVKTQGIDISYARIRCSIPKLILCLKKNISPELACFCMNRIIASATPNGIIYNELIAERAKLFWETTISNLEERREHFNAQFGYIFEQKDFKPSAPPYDDVECGTTDLSSPPPPSYQELSFSR